MTKHKPRILIVEDDENIRETIKNILEQSGYDTDVVKTGQEAERKTKQNSITSHYSTSNFQTWKAPNFLQKSTTPHQKW